MKYLQKKFSVPVAGPSVTQAEWDRVFTRTLPSGAQKFPCRKHEWKDSVGSNWTEERGYHYFVIAKRCTRCGAEIKFERTP